MIGNFVLNFNAPFPFVEKVKDKFLIALFFGVFVFSFLLVFQPFNVEQLQNNKLLLLSGYGGITFRVTFLSFISYPWLTKTSGDSWTIKKMFFFTLSQFSLISIANWGYHNYFIATYAISLFHFFFITLSVGSFPTLFLLFWLERKWRLSNQASLPN